MNINKLVKSILRLRWIIISLVLLFTVFSGYQITRMQINSDVISSLPDDDPDAALLKRIANQFGSNKMGMVILENDDIFQTAVLEDVKQITDSIKMIDGVMSVTSLTSIIDINEFGIGTLVDPYDLPDTQEELQMLRERVFAKEMSIYDLEDFLNVKSRSGKDIAIVLNGAMLTLKLNQS